jgi:hypothetical protein
MASLYNDRMAFIHVPKTGGTWVTNALRAAGVEFTEVTGQRGHATWADMPPDRFRFGFVREWRAWHMSYWVHKKRWEDYPEPINAFDAAVRDSDDFESFMRLVDAEQPRFLDNLYQSFLGPAGAIEFVGSYENLADELERALGLAGVEYDREALRAQPRANESALVTIPLL